MINFCDNTQCEYHVPIKNNTVSHFEVGDGFRFGLVNRHKHVKRDAITGEASSTVYLCDACSEAVRLIREMK